MKDYFDYKDKICIVTGAASGMGKATTEILVDLGAKVYALDCSEINIQGTTEEFQIDLGDKNSIDSIFSKLPQNVDCFFGIAGVSGITTDFKKTIVINFLANKYITETYLSKSMSEGGAIAYITSEAGLRWERQDNMSVTTTLVNAKSWEECIKEIEEMDNGYPGNVGYAVSKRAMNHLISYLLEEFGPKGIRINAVLPGTTNSGMKDEFAESAGGMDNLISFAGFNHRLANSEEMAYPIIFLNSSMASYINGTKFIVDDGLDSRIQGGYMQDIYGFKLPRKH